MTTNVETQDKAKNSAPNSVQDFFSRMGVLGELLFFLWKRKQFWLIPMVVVLLLFAVIIVIGSSGPGGIFIYSLF